MKNTLIVLAILILVGVGYFAFVKKDSQIAQQLTPTPTKTVQVSKSPVPVLENETAHWTLFKSSYLNLSFKVPVGFEVKEGQDYVLVAKSPYTTRAIGDDNAFFSITRYNQYHTREGTLADYRKTLRNIKESTRSIDGFSFLTLSGDDDGRFEGTSAGRVTVIFFDASWLEVIERPANSNQSFNPIAIGDQIISTFKFTK